MIEATNTLTLGSSLHDGSPVHIDSGMGPLLVFDNVGSGKTVAARKLFEQLADNRQSREASVIALDSYGQGYTDIARKHGGTAWTIPKRDEAVKFAAEHSGSGLPEELRVLAIDTSSLRLAAARDTDLLAAHHNLRTIIWGYLISEEAPTHLVLDPVDPLLADPETVNMLCSVWRAARSTNTVVVAVVSDPEVLLRLDAGTSSVLTFGPTLLIGEVSSKLRRQNQYVERIPQVLVEVSASSGLRMGEAALSTPGGGVSTLAIDPVVEADSSKAGDAA